MKKGFLVLVVFFLSCCVVFALEEEGIVIWRRMVRNFAGANHLYAKVFLRMYLIESGDQLVSTEYGIEFWVRDLRDYRLDILKPEILSGITFLFRYKENFFSVLDQNTKKRANQRVTLQDANTSETDLNPQELLSSFADFLLNLIEKYNPLLKFSYSRESEWHVFLLNIQEPIFLSVFKKDYPVIQIFIDEQDSIKKILLKSEKTNEYLEFVFEEFLLSIQPLSSIQEAFSIRESEYQLIEYINLK